MIAPTFGLTHISPAVADLDRSLAFYRALFGVEVLVRDERQIQVSTPGSKGVIAFECNPQAAGREGGVGHFGFRLTTPRISTPRGLASANFARRLTASANSRRGCRTSMYATQTVIRLKSVSNELGRVRARSALIAIFAGRRGHLSPVIEATRRYRAGVRRRCHLQPDHGQPFWRGLPLNLAN
jgi:catechol 2,3-dioxygenase-like lactoylglutathione lyase family enzyme